MDGDRRQSMRVSTRLPCEWQLVDDILSATQLQDVFNLPPGASVAAALFELSAALDNTLENIQDLHIRHAISIVNEKIDLLAPAGHHPDPLPVKHLGLSHDGMQFVVNQELAVDQIVAVHLLLEDKLSFLQCGSVTRCCAVAAGFEVGLTFSDMSASNSKRLARQVMRTRR
ncbi:MAG: PilZ domain-containing protein [bacterium]